MILDRIFAANTRLSILLPVLLLFLPALHADEITLALDTAKICNYTPVYDDQGSGGDQDIAFYTPQAPTGYYLIGG